MTRRPVSYVLPLRWERDRGLAELIEYLRGADLDELAEVVVVDGSPPSRFALHAELLPNDVCHVRPDPVGSRMGKVDGVLTGLRLASHEAVVIADDDVRWDASALDRAVRLLQDAEVVRPQNYFDPLPWHARLDTARSLINRAFFGDLELGPGDFPGTLVVRRSALRATGGYDGDVLFENLELMRTVAAAGGRVLTPQDLFVRRLPPDTRHFLSQRVRQAYDDFALPLRMLTWLAVAPALLASRMRTVMAVAVVATAVAETGRRRAGGTRVFPATSSLLAPIWVLERALCSWAAVWQRFCRGGVPYAGQRIERSATPSRILRRRYAARSSCTAGSRRSASPSAAPSA